MKRTKRELVKTLHINYVDTEGRVYCYRGDAITELNAEHFSKWCDHCPYFAGSAQGMGVNCLFNDGSNKLQKVFDDPAISRMDAKKSQKVALK